MAGYQEQYARAREKDLARQTLMQMLRDRQGSNDQRMRQEALQREQMMGQQAAGIAMGSPVSPWAALAANPMGPSDLDLQRIWLERKRRADAVPVPQSAGGF